MSKQTQSKKYSSILYDLLYNQVRRQIIQYLESLMTEGLIGSYPYQISKEVKVNISTVYHHLKKLKEHEIVEVKDTGYRKYYSLTQKGNSLVRKIRELEDKGIIRKKLGKKELKDQLKNMISKRDDLLQKLMKIGEEYKSVDLTYTSDINNLEELYGKVSRELLKDLDEVKETIKVIEEELYGRSYGSRYNMTKRKISLRRKGIA